MKQIVCLLCLSVLKSAVFAQGSGGLQPIGNWREHLPYHQVIAVSAGNNQVYAATSYALFTLDFSDNSLHTFSKISGLSATGVASIAFDSTTDFLIVAYNNNFIDIVKNGVIKKITALQQSTIAADKRVRKIYCLTGKAYLCTGFGIVVLDEEKNEVNDTYIVGDSGEKVAVNAFTCDQNFFYAATAEGLKIASIHAVNLADYRSWQQEVDLGRTVIRDVAILTDGHPIILRNDSVYIKQDTVWALIYSSNASVHSLITSANQLLISEGRSSTARVIIMNNNGTIARTIQSSNIKLPEQALSYKNDIWVADSLGSLIKVSGSSFIAYAPNSPASISLGETVIMGNMLWTTSGAVDVNWNAAGNKSGLFEYRNNEWSIVDSSTVPALDSLGDFITVAIDSRNNYIWAGSFGGGLLQLRQDKSVSVFKQNSPLQSPAGKPGIYNVSGLALDHENNLWVANYGGSKNLHVRKNDGSWQSFTIPFVHTENAVSQILIDDFDQKWIISPKGNGLFSFNHGTSIDNPADDKWRLFRAGPGNGNLPDNDVLCIAKDKSGFIWVGTGSGIAIIPCIQEVFTNPSCEAVLPIVQSGGFNGFLFHDERVQAIAVDGGDRKWVGSKNGVWLISADGGKTLYHFTEDNSPLLSNDVHSIAIDGSTGEVFFSTRNGICSFRGTATDGGNTNTNVTVYPNPVPPGYSGQVAIRGLVNNAIVKVTELDGRLVYQARALGGQAIWDGRDYKGNRVSSGIYLVLVTSDNRKENLATKIVFLH